MYNLVEIEVINTSDTLNDYLVDFRDEDKFQDRLIILDPQLMIRMNIESPQQVH
ncbi:MAG: hypothetical protein KC646_17620 [Candidatus Cloacimonetes bacterium]|nr:hypothetical protein [Candidatus Cloacimonadota bacterium]